MAEETRLRPTGTYIRPTAAPKIVPLDPVDFMKRISEAQQILNELTTSLVGFVDCKVTRQELSVRTGNAANAIRILMAELPRKPTGAKGRK